MPPATRQLTQLAEVGRTEEAAALLLAQGRKLGDGPVENLGAMD